MEPGTGGPSKVIFIGLTQGLVPAHSSGARIVRTFDFFFSFVLFLATLSPKFNGKGSCLLCQHFLSVAERPAGAGGGGLSIGFCANGPALSR